MIRVNLIPAYRLDARKRAACIRRWMAGCVVYCLFLLATYVTAWVLWPIDEDGLERELVKFTDRIDATKRTIVANKPILAQTHRTLKANLNMQSRPQWSTLLGILANKMGDEVLLRSCELAPEGRARRSSEENSFSPSTTGTPLYVLSLAGLAATQSEVSRYVLELEKTSLFEEVRLMGTRTEPFGAKEVYAFDLECALGSKEPPGGSE